MYRYIVMNTTLLSDVPNIFCFGIILMIIISYNYYRRNCFGVFGRLANIFGSVDRHVIIDEWKSGTLTTTVLGFPILERTLDFEINLLFFYSTRCINPLVLFNFWTVKLYMHSMSLTHNILNTRGLESFNTKFIRHYKCIMHWTFI